MIGKVLVVASSKQYFHVWCGNHSDIPLGMCTYIPNNHIDGPSKIAGIDLHDAVVAIAPPIVHISSLLEEYLLKAFSKWGNHIDWFEEPEEEQETLFPEQPKAPVYNFHPTKVCTHCGVEVGPGAGVGMCKTCTGLLYAESKHGTGAHGLPQYLSSTFEAYKKPKPIGTLFGIPITVDKHLGPHDVLLKGGEGLGAYHVLVQDPESLVNIKKGIDKFEKVMALSPSEICAPPPIIDAWITYSMATSNPDDSLYLDYSSEPKPVVKMESSEKGSPVYFVSPDDESKTLIGHVTDKANWLAADMDIGLELFASDAPLISLATQQEVSFDFKPSSEIFSVLSGKTITATEKVQALNTQLLWDAPSSDPMADILKAKKLFEAKGNPSVDEE